MQEMFHVTGVRKKNVFAPGSDPSQQCRERAEWPPLLSSVIKLTFVSHVEAAQTHVLHTEYQGVWSEDTQV